MDRAVSKLRPRKAGGEGEREGNNGGGSHEGGDWINDGKGEHPDEQQSGLTNDDGESDSICNPDCVSIGYTASSVDASAAGGDNSAGAFAIPPRISTGAETFDAERDLGRGPIDSIVAGFASF